MKNLGEINAPNLGDLYAPFPHGPSADFFSILSSRGGLSWRHGPSILQKLAKDKLRKMPCVS